MECGTSHGAERKQEFRGTALQRQSSWKRADDLGTWPQIKLAFFMPTSNQSFWGVQRSEYEGAKGGLTISALGSALQDSLSGAPGLCASLDPGSELFHLLQLPSAPGQLPTPLCFKLKKKLNCLQFMGTLEGQCFWLSVYCSFVLLVLCSFEVSFIVDCSVLERICLVILSSHREVFSGSEVSVLLSG